MYHYYVLVLTSKETDKLLSFDLIVKHEIKTENDFLPYYVEILSDHGLKKESIIGVALHKVKLEKQTNYVVILKKKSDMRHETFDLQIDQMEVVEQVFEMICKSFSLNRSNYNGILLHKVRRELAFRKL